MGDAAAGIGPLEIAGGAKLPIREEIEAELGKAEEPSEEWRILERRQELPPNLLFTFLSSQKTV